MGRVALRIQIDRAKEEMLAFIRFLDSLDLEPRNLPQDDFRALAEADAFFRKYSELLSTSKRISHTELSETANLTEKLEKISRETKENILHYILENLSLPNNKQFENYHAYAKAEKAWYDYDKFVKKHKFEQFSLERMQALIDRSKRPELLLPALLSFADSSIPERIDVIQEALRVLGNLIKHTPRSEFSSKTPYQKREESQNNQFIKFKEETNLPSFSDYDFDALFNKFNSNEANERKKGEKLMEELWNNYIDEKHGRLITEDKKHHKNIIALWKQVKERFDRAKSADEKILALKPFVKLWCTFIPSQFYEELKELIIKGIFDDSGTVRYRIVRIIESVAFELLEYAPEGFTDLLETIKDKRETYMREHKLNRSKNANTAKTEDGTLRSLTQALEFLKRQDARNRVFGPIL